MGRHVRLALSAAALVASASVGAAGDGFGVPLTVTEPDGVARRAEPITGGIPLPKGRFRAGRPFALFAADGKEVPCQTAPLVVDADGTARWVLLDFQADLPAGATKRYVLRAAAPAARPARPVRVTSTADAVTVDTGAASFTISRTRPFGLFSAASGAGKAVVAGGRVSYTDGFTGKTHHAAAPDSIAVEHAGAMRATVAVKGRFVGDDANRFRYAARVTAWAGRSDVHVKYSLCNSNPAHYCYRTVTGSTIELTLADEATGSVLGASKPIAAGADAELVQTLLPGAAGAGRAIDGGKTVWTSKAAERAQGWIAARLGGRRLRARDLYFADDPARRLAVSKRALVLSGIVERPADQAKARGRPYDDTARCLYDCSHLSSQHVIDFAPGSPPPAAPPGRVHAQAAPSWYLHETEALPYGRFGTQADEMACFDAWGWAYDPKDAPTRPGGSGKYRLSRYLRSIDNHYEPEEDPLDHMLIMYLRTGRRAYFDYALTWSNYAEDLYAWRTDGWRFKDGGVWWGSGPKGHRPQREADPVTGTRNYLPGGKRPHETRHWKPEMRSDAYRLATSKSCYCHNWAQGLLAWYLLTGDRDALEAAVDRVEQDVDTIRRARAYKPGVADGFSRDFTRASYNIHAARFVLPRDEYLREASDYIARVYLRRPTKEPRGLVNGAKPWRRGRLRGGLKAYVGERGLAEMKRLGHVLDPDTGRMSDPKTGRSWQVLHNPHTWMFPPLSRAMGLYYRLTGNEDAHDWTIAYGQAAARVLYQEHGLLTYGRMLVDFPRRGVAKDHASWVARPGTHAEGLAMSGYLARFYPDVAARAYSLCGEPLLKDRARDYWLAGSHRAYRSTKMTPLDRVGMWLNYVSTHDGQIDFVGRTIYEWSHPRKDTRPPAAVTDLKVTVAGDKATVAFTTPADAGGKVARYQVKCAAHPIVDYEQFLARFNGHEDGKVRNWWMAANLTGEPAPKAAGSRERFTLTGLPAGRLHFAVRSFDDSGNRSALSNVAAALHVSHRNQLGLPTTARGGGSSAR